MTNNSEPSSKSALTLAESLARPELLSLVPYESARRIGGRGDIWINANESPFNNSDLDTLNRYPECQPEPLINAYSQYAKVPVENIVSTRGADEGIELLIRTFCTPGVDKIACFGPTYGMYAISAQTYNVGVNNLNLTDSYQLPENYASQIDGAKVVFICNPNNPTGTIIQKQDITAAVEAMPNAIVVVDEAYIEFSPQYSVADLVTQYPNLVVLRTLSKAFALAGARCGFLMANSDIISLIMRVIAPYPVPLPVAELAQKALSITGIELMQQQVAQLSTQGQRLSNALQQAGAKVLPAHGNFVLAEFTQPDTVSNALQQAGIVARAYKDPRLQSRIRFSFSHASDTDRLIDAINSLNSPV
ncbi:histidinol-phosphate transaminase [Shewanella sp. MMG014]|uniref:histidinol-phosphate transaminase n=1 Tax=Shewanella sp. MMG014 TaxID=2822691 RepID=UPI001B39155F|nr:histidinol-phosphate transaminase [Shewanella sp. MMG014]MBQ4889015.1 histidinol-phosphate transaminase [Shewanella sp. MMG014]